MKRVEFLSWASCYSGSKNMKYIRDIVCRAERVERAFQSLDPGFSYEAEFARDGGAELLRRLSLEGRALSGTGIALPLCTNQMAAIKSSALWYMRFLSETSKK